MTTNLSQQTAAPTGDRMYQLAMVLCEPQLSSCGFYPMARKKDGLRPEDLLNLLAYSDGHMSLLKLARLLDQPLWELAEAAGTPADVGLLKECPPT